MKNVVGFLILGLLVVNCRDFLDKDPKVTFRDGNVLLPQIQFETHTDDRVYIEYWPEQRLDKRQSSTFSTGRLHAITLVNLTQLTTYQFRVCRAGRTRKSKTFSFVTGAVPETVFQPEKVKIDTSLFNGYILVRRLSKSGADAILNNEGDVVWYHLYDTVVSRAFSWTKYKTVLSTYDSAEIVEVDLMGNEVLRMNLEDFNISNKLHHEIVYSSKDEISLITLDSARLDLRRFGGSRNQMLRADGLLVVNKQGQKIWDWNLLSQTSPLHFDGGSFSLTQSWGHANSFTIDAHGNYLVSFRDFNQIWKISRKDGSILWKLGKNGDFEMDPDSYFIWQHGIHFNSKGELMMFDNGSANDRPNSRVLCFRLDEDARKAVTTLKVVLPLELSDNRMCSAEYIADGKYLVCITRRGGVVAVVNDDGEILWKVILKAPSYRAYYLENPFRTDSL